MARYQRLNCCCFFRNIEDLGFDLEEQLEEAHFIHVQPFFRKDGWYYDRQMKACWYEYNGNAYTKEGLHEQFQHELDQLCVRWLEPPEIQAIKTLIVYGGCPKSLLEIYWKHCNNVMSKDICREAIKARRRILGN